GYSFGPNRFNSPVGTSNMELATDNAEGIDNPGIFGDAIARGNMNSRAIQNTAFYQTDKDFYNTPYKNIRRVNTILAKLPTTPFSTSTMKRIEGEVRFLRAWYYHYLIIAFGGVPIVKDTVYGINDVPDLPRSNYKDCVEYIVSELDKSASLLDGVVYVDADFGRATKGACLALKSRVLLYAASPLFNGGALTTDAALIPLISYPTADINLWKAAADAAEAVINLNIYALNENNTIRPGYGFYDLFLKRINTEYIFQYNRPTQKEFEAIYLPPSRSGSNVMRPTHNLAEAFPMRDGKPITESPLYDPSNPYANRDPRFDNSIIHNGMVYMSNNGTRTAVLTYQSAGSTIPNTSSDAYTPLNRFTGYFSRKMLDENLTNFGTPAGNTQRSWPLMRYAEILLNYAEAINETGETDKAYSKIIDLRKRAGILPGTDNQYGLKVNMSQTEMRELIRNERRIELAFEDQRWNDIRRWKILSTVFNGYNKVQIITRTGTNTYTYAVANSTRLLNYNENLHLLPIPLLEVAKMPKIIQNPGW
ncbi:MAG: RagB/SusD family nutrient uptake outer membrane protein, partial [Pyrinomonadaceae bacterium]|nr:RagB/SusD family nutrient uptake outer membrane protein [Sphingobacteriaceae bacterium]